MEAVLLVLWGFGEKRYVSNYFASRYGERGMEVVAVPVAGRIQSASSHHIVVLFFKVPILVMHLFGADADRGR